MSWLNTLRDTAGRPCWHHQPNKGLKSPRGPIYTHTQSISLMFWCVCVRGGGGGANSSNRRWGGWESKDGEEYQNMLSYTGHVQCVWAPRGHTEETLLCGLSLGLTGSHEGGTREDGGLAHIWVQAQNIEVLYSFKLVGFCSITRSSLQIQATRDKKICQKWPRGLLDISGTNGWICTCIHSYWAGREKRKDGEHGPVLWLVDWGQWPQCFQHNIRLYMKTIVNILDLFLYISYPL